MSDTDLSRIGEHSGVDFIFRADYDIDQPQRRAEGYTESALVSPLIWAVIDIQHDRRARLASQLGGEKRRAAARLFAQAGTAYQQYMTISQRSCQYVVDGKLDVGAVIAIVGQWEAVWRFDTQHDRAGPPSRLARNKLRFHPLAT